MKTNYFLFEIGLEEIPPKALKDFSISLANTVKSALTNSLICFDDIKWFASPRRVAFIVHGIASKQRDSLIEKMGPFVDKCYTSSGEPTAAALGFARSCKTSFTELSTIESSKGNRLFFKAISPGTQTIKMLPEIIRHSVNSLSLHREMRWGSGTYSFIRPVHWIVALYNDQIVDMTLFGKKSDNVSYGHRYMSPNRIIIDSPQSYCELLKKKLCYLRLE